MLIVLQAPSTQGAASAVPSRVWSADPANADQVRRLARRIARSRRPARRALLVEAMFHLRRLEARP